MPETIPLFMNKIEIKDLNIAPEICNLPTGVVLNEYSATPFLNGDVSKEPDIVSKKAPFFEKSENFLHTLNLKKVCEKNAYKILIELVENIYRYRIPAQKNIPVLERADIREDEKFIYICTANTIEESSKQKLEKKLGNLNELLSEDPSEALQIINNTRKEVLMNGIINEQGGAGLGFLDIAKKTLLPFKYSFIPVSHDERSLYLFRIEAKIEKVDVQKKVEEIILNAS